MSPVDELEPDELDQHPVRTGATWVPPGRGYHLDVGTASTSHRHDATDSLMLAIPPSNEASGIARRETDHWLRRVGASSAVRHDILLVVSELVTNAVKHTGSTAELELTRGSGAVHIGVRDHGTTTPRLRAGGVHGGFGLRIVDTTARRWGCERTASGKIVWADVPDRPAKLYG